MADKVAFTMKSTSLVWASAKARSALHYVAEESNSFFSPVNLRTFTGGREGEERGAHRFSRSPVVPEAETASILQGNCAHSSWLESVLGRAFHGTRL